jgi:hypothetical protein
MQVVRDRDGRRFVQAQEIGDSPLKSSQGFGRFQVTDVLADKNLPAYA